MFSGFTCSLSVDEMLTSESLFEILLVRQKIIKNPRDNILLGISI